MADKFVLITSQPGFLPYMHNSWTYQVYNKNRGDFRVDLHGTLDKNFDFWGSSIYISYDKGYYRTKLNINAIVRIARFYLFSINFCVKCLKAEATSPQTETHHNLTS